MPVEHAKDSNVETVCAVAEAGFIVSNKPKIFSEALETRVGPDRGAQQMIKLDEPFRFATEADLDELLPLAVSTAPGFVETFWSRMAEASEPPDAFGRRIQASYIADRSTVVAEIDGQIAAMLISFPLQSEENHFVDDADDMLRPVIELYARAGRSWHIHGVATNSSFFGKGLASRMLLLAEKQAIAAGMPTICLIVLDSNERAISLYKKRGYSVSDCEAFVACGANSSATKWLLMKKQID